MKSFRTSLCMLVAVAVLVMPGTSVAETATTDDVKVTMSIAENAVQTVDPNGDKVDRVLLDVTNGGAATIVFVRVDFPIDAAAAAYQDAPPAGWVMDVKGHAGGRDYVAYTGVLGPAESTSFHLRTVGLDSEPFHVSFDTLSAVTDPPPDGVDVTPTFPEHPTDPLCLQIPLSTAGQANLYLPVGAVAENTSYSVLTVLYDTEHRTYLSTAAASGLLKVHAPLAGDTRGVSNADTHALGLVDGPTGPILTPALEGETTFDVAKATLWAGNGPDAEWFVSNPGRYLVTSEDNGCAPFAFAVVPPQLDSDLDGFTNINELRSNANPVSSVSTPYSDDDIDGIPNGRDLVTTWHI